MPFPRLHLVLRTLTIAVGFGLAAMASTSAHASVRPLSLFQSTCEGSSCQTPPTTGCDLLSNLSCDGGGGEECPLVGGGLSCGGNGCDIGGLYDCGGEEYPPYGCDSRQSCGGEENPFTEPNTVLPPDGLPLDLNIQPPEDDEGEGKIVNAPITGSGNSDLIRGGGGSSNR